MPLEEVQHFFPEEISVFSRSKGQHELVFNTFQNEPSEVLPTIYLQVGSFLDFFPKYVHSHYLLWSFQQLGKVGNAGIVVRVAVTLTRSDTGSVRTRKATSQSSIHPTL